MIEQKASDVGKPIDENTSYNKRLARHNDWSAYQTAKRNEFIESLKAMEQWDPGKLKKSGSYYSDGTLLNSVIRTELDKQKAKISDPYFRLYIEVHGDGLKEVNKEECYKGLHSYLHKKPDVSYERIRYHLSREVERLLLEDNPNLYNTTWHNTTVDFVNRQTLDNMINNALNPQQKEVIEHHVFKEETFEEIRRNIGRFSRSYIAQVYHKALRKLRGYHIRNYKRNQLRLSLIDEKTLQYLNQIRELNNEEEEPKKIPINAIQLSFDQLKKSNIAAQTNK